MRLPHEEGELCVVELEIGHAGKNGRRECRIDEGPAQRERGARLSARLARCAAPRVEPSREVKRTEAIPDMSPVRQKRINLMRSTRTPEKRAAVTLLPIIKMRRPKFVLCSST